MLNARQAWIDLEQLHELLEKEEEPQKFKYFWISAIVICRSIGSILDKVDKQEFPDKKSIITSQWREIQKDKSNNKIFHDFIKFERDALVHEYIDRKQWGDWLVTSDKRLLGVLSEGLFCPMEEGPYMGEDCRDVMRVAIQWWDKKIKEIEYA